MEKLDLKYYLSIKYPVEVRELSADEGGGWLASIPLLGRHVFRAVGDSVEEAIDELHELRVVLLADMYERGRHIAVPPSEEREDYSGTPGLRMPKELHRLVAERAKEQGVSQNQYMVTLIASGIGADTTQAALVCEVRALRGEVRELASCTPLRSAGSHRYRCVMQSRRKRVLAD